MSTRDDRPRPSPDAVFRGLREGGVILHLGTGEYHGVNPVGVLIWRLLDGERTIAEITTAVAAEVEDPPADLEAHVTGFVARLRERALLSD